MCCRLEQDFHGQCRPLIKPTPLSGGIILISDVRNISVTVVLIGYVNKTDGGGQLPLVSIAVERRLNNF